MENVRDVVGLYLSPPEKAIVLCIDEKPQVQARERTQPVLPMAPARTARGTHDSTRRGTTSLFAALNVATGAGVGKCHRRHRSQEFVKFLDHVSAPLPKEPGASVHVVPDDYGTHETPAVKRWFLRHPEYHRARTRLGGLDSAAPHQRECGPPVVSVTKSSRRDPNGKDPTMDDMSQVSASVWWLAGYCALSVSLFLFVILCHLRYE